MSKTSPQPTLSMPLFTLLRLTVSALLLALALASEARANEVCADLFQPHYEGLLHNPAAKAHAMLMVKSTLPSGVYNVRMTSSGHSKNETLGISYSGADGSMLVRLGSTYLFQGSPLQPSTLVQLLPNQNVVISGSVRMGDFESYNGESVRQARIEFSERKDGTVVLFVQESTKNRSVFRNSPTEFQTSFALEIIR